MKKLNSPLNEKDILNLRAGDEVLLTGDVYTARDQAHKRMAEAIKKGKKAPFNIRGQAIYYCGPTKTPKEKIIGSCGPTTSRRMDEFTPLLLRKGLKAMIGKGARSKEVREAIKKNKAVYLLAPAGCGALITKYIKSAKAVAYQDLGPERIMKLKVKDFPLIVGIDAKGRSIYGQA
jgi:fumarate hydratase subunit beta